ncbi:MAG: M24 family metallopeptidase [Acidobacteria bacterium]|nr:M24 family metallopeptidase [Acidobacteriota bacterium]
MNHSVHLGHPGHLSRRELIQGVSAGIAVTTAGALLTACNPAPDRTASPAGALTPASMPQRFSQEEMNRRWSAVRAAMREQGFDGLLVTNRTDGNADVKYLTETNAPYAVFAMDGKALAITEGGGGNLHDGVETREVSDDIWSAGINAAISELGLTRGRIGVGYLQDIVRLPEGGFNYATLDRVRKGNPRARFDSAADLLLRVKLPRSAEEIAVHEKATEVSEAGLQAMMEVARPGAIHRDVWLRVYNTLVSASGEFPTRLSLRSGQEGNTGSRPLEEAMQAGQILNQEISAKVLGYGSQVNHSVCVGGPAPADWESAAQYCIDLFHNLVDWIRPGRPIREAMDFYQQEVEKRGSGYWGVLFHSGGGNDGPRWGPGRPEAADAVLQEGMVFTIKPRIPIKGIEAPTAQIGDAIVVTATGARRLGKRNLEVRSVGV